MENVSTAGLVALGTVLGACVSVVLDRKRKEECDTIRETASNRLQRFRARKKEEDEKREREQKEKELELEAKHVRKIVLQRQKRSRLKRETIKTEDDHIGTLMLWYVEDLVRVQSTLQCLAWNLDISYPGDLPFNDMDICVEHWTVLKSISDQTWFWNICYLLLTQELKLSDGTNVSVLDCLQIASKNYPGDEFIAHDIVYVVHMISVKVIEMDLGYIYHKFGFNITNAEHSLLWNAFTEGQIQICLPDENELYKSSPREICVKWKVSILERIQKEFTSYFTTFALSDWANEDEKYLACSIQREIIHYLSVTQYLDVAERNSGGLIWCEDVVHLSKKGNLNCEWVQSNFVCDGDSIVEERGRFRICSNIEQSRSRIFMKANIKKGF